MIRRADHDRIDIFVREQVVIVGVGRDAVVRLPGLAGVVVVDQLLRVLHPPAVEIASRHDPRHVVLPDSRQVVAA
jgi:hypothetical protein